MEFDKLEFACDIEQLQARFGGHFTCFVKVPGIDRQTLELGEIGWKGEQPTGRDVFRKTCDVPSGAGMVQINTGRWKDYFIVHRVDVKATFRPAAEKPGPLVPLVTAWMQTEFLPEGGRAFCGEKELESGHAYGTITPGKCRLRYSVPGRDDVFDQEAVLEPGLRYGFFVNLDSPFKWSQAGPEKMGHYPAAGLSLAPLPGGGWIAAWSTMQKKIMLCTTKDLGTWSEPAPAPFNSVFDNMTPTLHAGKDGTVWLAYFSTRLSLLDISRPEHRLWLTNTRDGKTWAPARPVEIAGPINNMPAGPAQMLEGPDGRCWIFWCQYTASAASFEDIRELVPLMLSGVPEGAGPTEASVALDADGLFHMGFASYEHGIGYTTSKDGATWSKVTFPVNKSSKFGVNHPRLIVGDGKVVVLFQCQGSWLLPIRAGAEPVDPDSGLRFAGIIVSLYGSRPYITKDGEVLLLAGSDTSWLLRARLKDLLALCEKD
jgi:hypothetical protein